MNRSQIVSSCPRNNVLPRIISVTRRAQRREDMGELARDESATDDDQVLGNIEDPHDRVAGVVPHTGIGDLVGDDGSRAGCDDHLVGGEFVAVIGAQRVAAVGLRRTEAGVGVENRDVRRRATVVLTTYREWIDAAEDPRDDVTPADFVDTRVDPVSR